MMFIPPSMHSRAGMGSRLGSGKPDDCGRLDCELCARPTPTPAQGNPMDWRILAFLPVIPLVEGAVRWLVGA